MHIRGALSLFDNLGWTSSGLRHRRGQTAFSLFKLPTAWLLFSFALTACIRSASFLLLLHSPLGAIRIASVCSRAFGSGYLFRSPMLDRALLSVGRLGRPLLPEPSVAPSRRLRLSTPGAFALSRKLRPCLLYSYELLSYLVQPLLLRANLRPAEHGGATRWPKPRSPADGWLPRRLAGAWSSLLQHPRSSPPTRPAAFRQLHPQARKFARRRTARRTSDKFK